MRDQALRDEDGSGFSTFGGGRSAAFLIPNSHILILPEKSLVSPFLRYLITLCPRSPPPCLQSTPC